MSDEITRSWLRANGFGELLDEERAEERERILAVVTTAFRAGVPVTDELVDRALRDPSVSARDLAAGLFSRQAEERELAEARERALHVRHLQDLRDAEARLAPHVPAPDTSATHDEWDDGLGDMIRRAGDHVERTRGAR